MKYALFKDLTRIDHTLFGLPFTLGGALLPLASQRATCGWMNWLWIFPAFLLARISGMAFNQLVDRHIDAKNVRTCHRVIPTGRVSPAQAAVVAWSTLLLFVLVCYQINFLCFLFAPIAAFLIFIYAYMKRIHASCHLVLGIIHFLGPVMAYMAISGTLAAAPLFLGLAALLTISGNDIIYALQDYAIDVEQGIHSLPAKLGISAALRIAALFHAFSLIAFLCIGIFGHLHWSYFGLLPLVAALQLYFHCLLHAHYRGGTTKSNIEPIFFFSNLLVSISFLFFIGLSLVWAVL